MSANRKTRPGGRGMDRRKLSLAIALGAVMMLLWGRLLLKQQVPRTAVAKPPAAAAAAEPKGAWAAATRARIVQVSLPEAAARDLFALDPRLYPQKPVRVMAAPAKSAPQVVDEQSRLEAAVRAEAAKLRLQTTVGGDQPQAVIDGVLLTPGQKIRGFQLKKVMTRQVLLEMNGIHVLVQM